MTIRFALAFAAGLSLSSGTMAACAFQNSVPIKIMSASFPAWKAVTAAMQECGNVQVELDMQYRDKQPAALAAKPALLHIAGTSSNNLVTLLNDGTVRPLDELVAKYGQQLTPNQLVRIDGKIVAVAMMVNTQHLMYRADILEQLKIAPPTTYDEMLAAAEKIKQSGVVTYPLGGTYKAGWDLATEFVNLFMGFGGTWVDAKNAPTVKGDAGMKTLAMMKKLTAYMDPEYLTSDATFVAKQFQQGKVAMANFWASRAGAIDDAKESTVSGKVVMAAAAAAMPGGKPATTLFWDGFAIAKNITDAEAEVAFRIALEGIDDEMLKANNAAAVWLIKGYQPSKLSEGAAQSAAKGAPSYPATTYMGLMQTVLGTNLPDFLAGRKDAEQTLAAIEAAYTTSAKDRGILK